MRKHPVVKFLGLTVLYAALIVGIFILQFKTESVISRTIGDMHITLAQTEDKNNQVSLKNQFQVNFRGISFRTAENSPALAQNSQSGEQEALVLDGWEQKDTLSVEFSFTDGAKLTFSVSDESPEAFLNITAQLPKDYDTITLPYSALNGTTIQNRQPGSFLATLKDKTYLFSAPLIEETSIALSAETPFASYMSYVPSTTFKFADTAGLKGADSAAYKESITQLRNSVISQFTQQATSARSNSLTELEVVAYVAEMTSRNRFPAALEAVSAAFKRNKSTYISSPYFAVLARHNTEIGVQSEKYASMVKTATTSGNLDIFTVDGIADYILREKKTAAIQTLLAFPAKQEEFAPSIVQAGGILSVYAKLARQDANLAAALDVPVQQCLDILEAALSIDDEALVFAEEDLSAEEKIRVGQALIDYANMTGRNECGDAGRLLVTESNPAGLDFPTIAALYPVLVQDNHFYPHTEVLGYYGTRPVWAWTCASSISYKIAANNVVNISIDFPLGYSHYVLFSGIPTFHDRIRIQNLDFHTDPRYETYNSSGFIYNKDDKTLDLKSRHKSQIELVELFCDPAPNFTKN